MHDVNAARARTALDALDASHEGCPYGTEKHLVELCWWWQTSARRAQEALVPQIRQKTLATMTGCIIVRHR